MTVLQLLHKARALISKNRLSIGAMYRNADGEPMRLDGREFHTPEAPKPSAYDLFGAVYAASEVLMTEKQRLDRNYFGDINAAGVAIDEIIRHIGFGVILQWYTATHTKDEVLELLDRTISTQQQMKIAQRCDRKDAEKETKC